MKIRINERIWYDENNFVMLIINNKIIKEKEKNKIIVYSIFFWIFILGASVFLAKLTNSVYGINGLCYFLLIVIISIIIAMISNDLYFIKTDKKFNLLSDEVKELTQLTSANEILEKLKLWGYLNNSTQKSLKTED